MHKQIPCQGTIYIILGGSGSGKSTITKMLCEQYSNVFIPVYFTTRKQRPGENDGVDYHFVSKETFEKLKNEGRFRYTYVCHENDYGIPAEIKKMIGKGSNIILGLSRKLISKIKEDFSSVKLIYIDLEESESVVRMIERDPEIVKKDMEIRMMKTEDIGEWARNNKERIDLFIQRGLSLDETLKKICYFMERGIS